MGQWIAKIKMESALSQISSRDEEQLPALAELEKYFETRNLKKNTDYKNRAILLQMKKDDTQTWNVKVRATESYVVVISIHPSKCEKQYEKNMLQWINDSNQKTKLGTWFLENGEVIFIVERFP